MYLIKLFSSLLMAQILSAILTSFFILFQNTIWNILWLKTQGFNISFVILFQSLLHDLRGGLSPMLIQWGIPINMYGIIFIALSSGYLLAAIVRLIIPINSIFLYGFAGFASVYGIIFFTKITFDEIVLISSTRELMGLLIFCFIGLLGGIIFSQFKEFFLKVLTYEKNN
ncbi:MAG: hypothetical protein CML94_01750 [Rhodobiaceae bacterium]|nr:hypothetical protein [Rhodobiaceae bacterium]|tara:strand:+ start:326 stop:835 length:510 start_codon:yes stop_codon:yes gene_type:complete